MGSDRKPVNGMSMADYEKKVPSEADVLFDPELFAEAFIRILTKQKDLVPFVWNRAQKDFHAHRTGRDLILKSRQLGFTTYVQAELFHRTVTKTTNSITLTHDADATTKIRLMVDRFYDNCRFGAMQPARRYANAVLTTYPELDSAAAIATAGSLNTGRGDTYTDFHGSEVAFWPDAEKIVSGALQGGNPDAILESTPNGAQGYFFNLCMEALYSRSVWKLHFYPWWWDAEYKIALDPDEVISYTDEEGVLVEKEHLTAEQIKWRRAKKRELGRLFIQEYPEDPITCFLTSGQGYFGQLDDPVFEAPEGAVYNESHHYGGGLDFGQTVDYTALSVMDFTTREQVDLLHVNNLPWAEMRRRIAATARAWHLETLLAEKNSIGNPNIEELRRIGINVIPFVTTNDSKAGICADLNEALHFGGWKLLPIPLQRNELNSFVATQLPLTGAWRLAAAEGGHDDTVIANALAIHAGKFAVSDADLVRYGQGVTLPEDLDDDMIAYHADTYGMTFEQAKEAMMAEMKQSFEEMMNRGR